MPIEHKSGRYRPGGPADLQVAAQVLCLRSMFGKAVPHGIVIAGRERRRHLVPVGDVLARSVATAVETLREYLDSGAVPPAVPGPRCRRCSLREGCQPDAPTSLSADLYTPKDLGPWHD